MDGSVIRLFYFLFLALLNWGAFHWLWIAAIDSAGLTRQEVWAQRARYGRISSSRGRLTQWIIRHSKVSGTTRALLFCYGFFGILPVSLCIMLSTAAIWVGDVLDPVLNWAVWVLPAMILIAWIFGFVYRARRKKPGGRTDAHTLREDVRFLKKEVYDRETERMLEHYGGSRAKLWGFGILKLLLAIGLIAGLFFLILHFSADSGQKEIAPASGMQAAIEAYGYTTVDMTEFYREAWEAGDRLEQALSAQSGFFSFEYFVLDSAGSAHSIWTQYRDRMDVDGAGVQSRTERGRNYEIVRTQDAEYYEILVRVENTLVRAVSYQADSYMIRAVLMDTGYYFEE